MGIKCAPLVTTAEQFAAILARDVAERQNLDPAAQLCAHRIVSIPNGQQYGKQGHIPCDHIAEFLYMDGSFKTARTFGANFTIVWAGTGTGV